MLWVVFMMCLESVARTHAEPIFEFRLTRLDINYVIRNNYLFLISFFRDVATDWLLYK
ncbi:hypothetical protein THIOKS13320019 [Thiocapsa sp. KS1]|nr:hypothetical protein THIOKS13320019 [Thiocapsa sp. KS1]